MCDSCIRAVMSDGIEITTSANGETSSLSLPTITMVLIFNFFDVSKAFITFLDLPEVV